MVCVKQANADWPVVLHASRYEMLCESSTRPVPMGPLAGLGIHHHSSAL